jgi:alpha-L-fucosidase 2
MNNTLSSEFMKVPVIPLQAWYDAPAQSWESEALPLGNGFIGAMVFGGVGMDRILVNEHSLWSGGPGADPNYNGGAKGDSATIKKAFCEVRNELQGIAVEFSKNNAAYMDAEGKVIAKDYPADSEKLVANMEILRGDKKHFGSYQQLSDVFITDLYCNALDEDKKQSYTDYKRILDIDNAIAFVSYKSGGVAYNREYFVSNPAQALIIRLTADKPGSISKCIEIKSDHTNVNILAESSVLTMTGQPKDQNPNGLKFAQQIKVINTGGTLTVANGGILVEHADEALIIIAADTNWQQCYDNSYNYFSDINPLDKVKEIVLNAANTGYNKLKEEHIKDYTNLYNRVKFSLDGVSVPEKTTDKLVKEYNRSNYENDDLYLEMLYYQFGRYLLISSSRKGGLPANLQGIWAQGLNPPWSADYHTNINVQMNYWLAEQTNLSECHMPMIDYAIAQIPRGTETAKMYHAKQDGGDVRGWTLYHENNIWGNTMPATSYAFCFSNGAAWLCDDIWQHYLFTLDTDFLRKNYNAMLDAALFWIDNIWEDERDGTLVSNPSYSPEHGPFTLGCTSDQAIIWVLFDQVIRASEVLGIESRELDEIKNAKNRLHMPGIGLGGQLLEWKDEIGIDLTGDGEHRHANHLHILHPGSYIVAGRSEWDEKYVNAMKVSLNTRGDGGTGWSKAWKINFWARLRDGDRSHKLLSELLTHSTLVNLFDTHPPFQIDGNFGATAGMTEMLLQSQGDSVDLLAAIPAKWVSGMVSGLKARGNFEISSKWKNKTATSFEILSNSGAECVLRYSKLSRANIVNSAGDKINFEVIDTDKVKFKTTKGEVYNITL